MEGRVFKTSIIRREMSSVTYDIEMVLLELAAPSNKIVLGRNYDVKKGVRN